MMAARCTRTRVAAFAGVNAVARSLRQAMAVTWMAGAMAAAVPVAAQAQGAVSPSASAVVPMGVMGDSNSHSYQDAVSFPPGSRERGGVLRAKTFQWTEVLARLRPGVIDLGPWETSGQGRLGAKANEFLGRPGERSPRRQDYRYNMAYSGAGCHSLVAGALRQVQPLLAVMGPDAPRWRQGVVVIRIGMIPLSDPGLLDALARDPAAPTVQAEVQGCLRDVEQAVRLIRAAHPQTRIVLVGIFDDSNDPVNFGRWRSREALDNMAKGLDRFDGGLRELAKRSPNVSFFDDRAFFRGLWGQRDAQGAPAYRSLDLGPRLPAVSLSLGDEPRHALVADDHWGLVMNVLWAQALSRHLKAVGLPVAPIEDGEVRNFIDAQLR